LIKTNKLNFIKAFLNRSIFALKSLKLPLDGVMSKIWSR